ncbi:uncharacterized protein LOC127704767 [Mytilus californianus]|uniref:uncharacterized protein LOC127704767 n=1 Tax=Mytilus californianus TaxID=6549 RepID=UPI002247E0BF|nr:uncharacterized protein LOC127704767 [Mytilus californianus]XP_052064930.1 uncharacterized protein LOC127704767 [Mytilus californianus]XP_052064931.1 uncharacterized protein LOC127704767 [Mytilus californianus]
MGRHCSQTSSQSTRFAKLQKPLNKSFNNILSESSQKTYRRAIIHYKSFAEEYGIRFQLPLTSSDLILLIAHLKNKDLASSSMSTYISAIGFTHKINNWPDPTDSFIIDKVLKSVHKGRNQDMRLPITSTILNQLIDALKQTISNRYDQILFKAMFTLAYHALLRIGEMTVNNKNYNHVISLSQTVVLHEKLSISFMDFKHSNGKQFHLEIAKNKNNNICAVTALTSYLTLRTNTTGPLFLNSSGEAVSRQLFQHALNGALNFCGLSRAYYKPHSFRIGFATDASAKGLSTETIRNLGRWKSDAFKLYIRQSGQISNL